MAPRGWKQQRRMRGHAARVSDVSWSPDGEKLASIDDAGRLVTWDASTGKALRMLHASPSVVAVAWSPSSDAIAVAQEDVFSPDPYGDYAPDPDDTGLRALPDDVLLIDDELEEATNAKHYVRILDTDSGLHIGTLGFPRDSDQPRALVWPKRDRLFSASTSGIGIWQPEDSHFLGYLEDPGADELRSVTAAATDELLAAVGGEGKIVLWDIDSGDVRRVFESEVDLVCVGLARGFNRLAAGSEDGAVEVWDFGGDADTDVRTLEAHTGAVITCSFSDDGRLLATGSEDGTIKIWDTRDWALLSSFSRKEPGRRSPAQFAPNRRVLAAAMTRDHAVRTWEIDSATLEARRTPSSTVHYSNAKIVLLGDSGVGKTGLGLVLSGQSFRATESTHQRNVWPLPDVSGSPTAAERREVFLWDLAGQPGYRLLHQLHLNDVAVALVVFDAKSDLDPLSGVRHWARALNQAARLAKRDGSGITRILVAARLDRGGAKVSDAELRDVRREFGFSKYATTSAKEGEGIGTLSQAIEAAINWDLQPKVSSTQLFDSIRRFLLEKRDTAIVLATEEALRTAFVDTGAATSNEVHEEFRVCVDRAQARGLVRRFSFGDLILLRPEVLDAYAAAVLHAAGNDPNGLGEISEAAIRGAEFSIPSESRLASRQTEQLLMIATIEDLLRHEVALREDSGDGPYLVFPTESRRRLAVGPELTPWCRFRFEGPVQHVWATLIVRLTHSGVFDQDAVGDDCAVFHSVGDDVAVKLAVTDEGEGVIELLGKPSGQDEVERLLERFVEAHLRRRAVWNSVRLSRLVTCRSCGFVVPEALLESIGDAAEFNCPRCPEKIGLGLDPLDTKSPVHAEVRTLERKADSERSRLTARTTVDGKEAVHEFDTFLAYNSLDSSSVAALSEQLRDFGINPWLDRDQIPPGRWFQDVLQEAIGKSGSAVICLGRAGLGRWQELELRSFVEECVERKIPVIPLLLPGAKIPATARFLKQFEFVRFKESMDEKEPLSRLVWGITGDNSGSTRQDIVA
jgi:small GTP-binding protein